MRTWRPETRARRPKQDTQCTAAQAQKKAPLTRSRRACPSRGSCPRSYSRSGRSRSRGTCGGKGLEEVESTSSGLLLPGRTTSHDAQVRELPASTRRTNGRRRLGAASVAGLPTASAWSWPALTTLHTGCSARPSPSPPKVAALISGRLHSRWPRSQARIGLRSAEEAHEEQKECA